MRTFELHVSRGRSVSAFFPAGAAAMLFAASAFAVDGQMTGLLRELDPYPGGAAGEFVSSLGSVWVNQVGGYGVTLNNEDAGGTLLNFQTIWGSTAGEPPHRIFEEGAMDGGYTVTSIQTDAKVDNFGNSWYSASVTGGIGADSVFNNNSLLFAEGDAIPSLGGQFFSFASGIGLAMDGSKFYFIGGITNSAGGSTQNRGLFDQAGNVYWKGGDVLPGYSEPISTTSTPGFQIEVSAHAGNVMDKVSLVGGVGAQAMVNNSAALTSFGTALREGETIPVATPGVLPGEHWDNFSDWDINEAGTFVVGGDTDAATTSDAFVYSNTGFLLREGDVVDDFAGSGSTYTVTGSVGDIDMNEDGDWVVKWAADSSTNTALFLNGKLIAQEGDMIDFDGDGTIDANATITSFTGLDGDLRITDRMVNGTVNIYFTADIDINGTSTTLDDIETFVCVTYAVVPTPGAVALLGLAGAFGRRRRRRRGRSCT